MPVSAQQGEDRSRAPEPDRRPDPEPSTLDQHELRQPGLQPVPGLHGPLAGLRRHLVADPLGAAAVSGSVNDALRRRQGGGRPSSDSAADPRSQSLGIDTSGPGGRAAQNPLIGGTVGEAANGPAAGASRFAALVQPKLEVGAAGDAYEQEADRIASRVVDALRLGRGTDGGLDDREDQRALAQDASPVLSALVSRRATPGPIGTDGGVMDTGLEASLRAATSGGGAALAEPIRRQMEGAIGSDFSAVRMHTGPGAATLNDAISAEAFTTGNDIFFRDGLPDTGTAAGQSLLAHELVHTLQQSGGARRTAHAVQRRGSKKPKAPLDVIKDWVKYSDVSGKLRSSELKTIDNAVSTWVKGGRKTPGALDLNIGQIQAIFDAIIAWERAKTGNSVRDAAVADLRQALIPVAERAVAGRTKQIDDGRIAASLHAEVQVDRCGYRSICGQECYRRQGRPLRTGQSDVRPDAAHQEECGRHAYR